MNIQEELITENWEDVLDEKVPGRKSIMMSVFMMVIFLGVAIAIIGYRETTRKEELGFISLILFVEALVTFGIYYIIPQVPIRIPLSYIAKFFGISAGFSCVGFFLK